MIKYEEGEEEGVEQGRAWQGREQSVRRKKDRKRQSGAGREQERNSFGEPDRRKWDINSERKCTPHSIQPICFRGSKSSGVSNS
jgi:hypothetical protein